MTLREDSWQSLPAILSVGVSNPSRRYPQHDIYAAAARQSDFYRNRRIEDIFMHSDIDHRHLALDIESLNGPESLDRLHERYRTAAIETGKEAISRCLADGSCDVTGVDCIIAVSCTGYLCPGLCELFIRDLEMRTDVQRADLLGMGCAGAMPGLQRAFDFALAHPGRKALVVAVEVCSACYYFDESLETVVGNAICGDGAAAVLVGTTDELPFPRIREFETLLDPSLIGAVGFEQRNGFLRIVLSKDIREMAGTYSLKLVKRMLEKHDIQKEEIAHWIIHSGGRKVIDGIRRELGLTEEQVRQSAEVLRNYGNMSSPTVLFVLRRVMAGDGTGVKPEAGDLGVMLALGPGLAVEAALLEW